MRNIIYVLFTFFVFSSGNAQNTNHANWNTLLSKYVNSEGKVNYKALKNEEAKLNAYILELQKEKLSSLKTISQKKAYWINAYNAFTVQLILKNYPVNSINDIQLGDKKVFDFPWIELHGEKLSLNDIENKKIRAEFSDPRIHFALNCASISCPVLWNKAFTAENVEAALTQLTKQFLADQSRNKIQAQSLQLSAIFDWYASDFGKVREFIQKYSKVKIKQNAKITYLPYNWKLNE